MRTASLIMLSGLFVQVAHADEIRGEAGDTLTTVLLPGFAVTLAELFR